MIVASGSSSLKTSQRDGLILDDRHTDARLDENLCEVKGNLTAASENGIADAVLDDADLTEKVNGVAALGSDCDGISGAEFKITVRMMTSLPRDDGTHQHVAVQGLVQIEQL